MSLTLTDQDKLVIRTAAYGAVTLMTSAGAAGNKAHKIATDGSIALSSATGALGHVLNVRSTAGMEITGNSVAEIADQVLPALTKAMSLLKGQDPAEAANFRGIITVAVEASLQRAKPSPVLTEMARQITAALDAA